MSDNVPAISPTQDLALLTEGQLALIKKTIAKGATDDELRLFLEVARATDLNPFAKEIYFVKYTMRNGTANVAMPVGIDGLRRKAAESGDYAGQAGPFWCGEDGEWRDVWLGPGPPVACKVGVYRYMPNGLVNPTPTWAVVKWSEFAKDVTKPFGKFWKDMSSHMMAITAERHALRKAAPRLVEKIQAAGAQVINADYLIAKADQAQRETALPRLAPPADLDATLYQDEQESEGAGESEGDGKEGPVEWTNADLAKLKVAVEKRELSSKEWRGLLGLAEDAELSDVVALGSVTQVIQLLTAAFAKALAGEPTEQSKLGF